MLNTHNNIIIILKIITEYVYNVYIQKYPRPIVVESEDE